MKYLMLFMAFLAACNNKQGGQLKRMSGSEIVNLDVTDKINIDSVISVVSHRECVCTGPTGLTGKPTQEFRAYKLLGEVMTNDQLYTLLKNENPRIRFAAISILHDREPKLFKEGAKLLANDTSVVCSASGCSPIEFPLKDHIKFLNSLAN